MLQFCANMLLRPPLPFVPGVLRSNSMHSNSTLINWRTRRVNMLWVYLRFEPLQLTDSPSKAASAFPACSMFQRFSSLCLLRFHAYLSFWQGTNRNQKEAQAATFASSTGPHQTPGFWFWRTLCQNLVELPTALLLGPRRAAF